MKITRRQLRHLIKESFLITEASYKAYPERSQDDPKYQAVIDAFLDDWGGASSVRLPEGAIYSTVPDLRFVVRMDAGDPRAGSAVFEVYDYQEEKTTVFSSKVGKRSGKTIAEVSSSEAIQIDGTNQLPSNQSRLGPGNVRFEEYDSGFEIAEVLPNKGQARFIRGEWTDKVGDRYFRGSRLVARDKKTGELYNLFFDSR